MQNDCLRFIYKKKRSDRIPVEKLHKAKYKMLPINQVLYWRARSTWNSIRDKNAADYQMSNRITRTAIGNENTRFPSSYKRVHDFSEEPDPLYTNKKRNNRRN